MKNILALLALLPAGSFAQNQHGNFLAEVDAITSKTISYIGKGLKAESIKDEAFAKWMHWTPSLTASAGKSTWSPVGGGATSETNAYTLSSSWNLFSGGKSYYQSQAAEAASKGAQVGVLEAKRLAESAAAHLIFKKLFLVDQLKVYRGLADIKRESSKVVQERFRKGQAPLQEVTKSEIDLAQAESRVRSANLDVLANRAEIENFLERDIELKTWPLSHQEKWKSAFTNDEATPLAQSLEYELQAAEFGYKAARNSYSPSLDVALSYADGPDQNKTNYGGIASVTLTLPIWSRGETQAFSSAAFAAWKSLEAETMFALRDLKIQRKLSEERMSLARQNLFEAEQNLARVKSLYQGIQKGFQLGRISVNDLFLEQSRILDVELNAINQRHNFHTSFVKNCLLFNSSLKECLTE